MEVKEEYENSNQTTGWKSPQFLESQGRDTKPVSPLDEVNFPTFAPDQEEEQYALKYEQSDTVIVQDYFSPEN